MNNHLYTYDEIINKAKAELPISFRTDLRAKVDQYFNLVYNEIAYGFFHLANMEQVRQDQVPFSLKKARDALGRYGDTSKDNKFWWDWLHENFPLIIIHKKGNSIQGVRTMVSPVDIPMEVVLAGGNTEEIFKRAYADFDLTNKNYPVDYTPIDIKSLESYIAYTHAQNSVNPTIQKNLKDARIIAIIARSCFDDETGKHLLPQVISHSSFGRTYYKGINLQTVHKTVRHAALGNCYSVDINNAVFNWKYAFCKPHFNKLELSYTRELIQDKKRVRKQLAETVFGDASDYHVNIIKRVLTAIGFGAKATGKGWFKRGGLWTQGAISEIIYDKNLRDILFADDWMKNFMREQDNMNKYIGDEMIKDLINKNKLSEETLKDLSTERGNLSRGKLIAWGYQQTEAHIMDEMLTEANAKPILKVHDGVYFKTKPDKLSMGTVLRDYWPEATLSMEEINKFTYISPEVESSDDHRVWIEHEERAANDGQLPPKPKLQLHDGTQFDPHAEPDWDAKMRKEAEEQFSPPNVNSRPDFVKDILRKNMGS